MVRFPAVALAFLLAAVVAPAADPSPAGAWKLTVPLGPGEQATFLLSLRETNGTWAGEVLDSLPPLKVPPKVTGLTADGGHVRFTLDLDGRPMLAFDGVVAKDGATLGGSYTPVGGKLQVTELYPSKLKTLADEYELAREAVEQTKEAAALADAAVVVFRQASAKKLPRDEATRALDRLDRSAAPYGLRWERETALRAADTLAGQPGFTDLAVDQARRAEKLLTARDDNSTRLHVLGTVARALAANGQAADAKAVAAEVARVEAAEYAAYAKTHPGFAPTPFDGRKGKSDRAVLVEVFTGAECPPCAAVEGAVLGLLRSHTPAEAVVLQYHVHVPAPDALASPAADDRLKYYDDQVSGAPTAFAAGKLTLSGGGAAALAQAKYGTLRDAIDELLEKPAGVKLTLTVVKADKGYTAKATATGLAAPGEKVRLRFALTEERVRFAGGSGVMYHHLVVRAMPGGAKGFPLAKAGAEQAVAFDPDAIRAEIGQYLDAVPKTEGPFPRPDRPLALANLKLVAFVQNDATREVLHAVQVDVPK